MRRLRLEVGDSVVVYRYVLSLGVQRGYLLRRCELGVVADRCPAHLQHCLKYWYCLIVVTILEINFGVYISECKMSGSLCRSPAGDVHGVPQ